ncbi:acyl-CoA thioesterase-1 [Mucilaginibacter sp. OK268]|uniref:arylesterase n=1 Tax=Mucilaginibacter sp. OK268 TaxID=1881048 RepID=UPI00088B4903|nr:arylesterase [Mucilaginibacter sp. OK268]SDP31948.1 acyl-CoA thioesterase-1 [Mucilaginibacter sp. OK268]
MHKFKLTFLLLTTLIFAACDQNKKPSTDEGAKSSTAAQPDAATSKTVLFFGDSLTAGYGLDDPSEAFPGVIKDKIDSLKLPYKVVNAGLSGETTAGGNARLSWLLKQKVDIFILELGANDGLRGIPVSETSKNLQSIIDKVKAKYPEVKIVLLGMQVPPNMGADYANKFKAVYPDLTAKNHAQLVPFLLQGVAGISALNQADGIHPTAQGAKIVANNVWDVLKGVL